MTGTYSTYLHIYFLPTLCYRYSFHWTGHSPKHSLHHRSQYTNSHTFRQYRQSSLRMILHIRLDNTDCTFAYNVYRIYLLDTPPHTRPCLCDNSPNNPRRLCYKIRRRTQPYTLVYRFQWYCYSFVGYSLHCIQGNRQFHNVRHHILENHNVISTWKVHKTLLALRFSLYYSNAI